LAFAQGNGAHSTIDTFADPSTSTVTTTGNTGLTATVYVGALTADTCVDAPTSGYLSSSTYGVFIDGCLFPSYGPNANMLCDAKSNYGQSLGTGSLAVPTLETCASSSHVSFASLSLDGSTCTSCSTGKYYYQGGQRTFPFSNQVMGQLPLTLDGVDSYPSIGTYETTSASAYISSNYISSHVATYSGYSYVQTAANQIFSASCEVKSLPPLPTKLLELHFHRIRIISLQQYFPLSYTSTSPFTHQNATNLTNIVNVSSWLGPVSIAKSIHLLRQLHSRKRTLLAEWRVHQVPYYELPLSC